MPFTVCPVSVGDSATLVYDVVLFATRAMPLDTVNSVGAHRTRWARNARIDELSRKYTGKDYGTEIQSERAVLRIAADRVHAKSLG